MPAERVLLVASTAAHLRPLTQIAEAIKGSGRVDVSLLHFPSPCSRVASDLDEYTFHGYRIMRMSDYLNRLQTGSAEPRKRRLSFLWRIRLPSLRVLAPLFNLANLPLFYAVLGWQYLRLTLDARLRADARLNEAMSRTWIALRKAIRLLPRASTSGIGRAVTQVAGRAFFGLWGSQLRLDALDELLGRLQPRVLILPELNWGYHHGVLVNWARRHKVPVLVLPYTLAGSREWMASFQHHPECLVDDAFSRLMARAYPKWVREHQGKRLMLPWAWLTSSEGFGFSPAIPWVTNSGPDAIVAVDNGFTSRFYAREGVDTANWKVIGSLAEDRLHETRQQRQQLRADLAHSHGLRADRPWVLLALPPDQFDAIDASKLEYEDFNAMVRAMVSDTVSCAGERWEVLINLHPRIAPDSVAWLNALGAKVVIQPIETLLPLADLFVGVASATIRWAIACGIPAVNYDVYHYEYDDYHGCAGVIEISQPDSYRRVLRQLLNEHKAWQDLREKQEADSRRDFAMDGRARLRLVELVNRLAGQSNVDNDDDAPIDHAPRTCSAEH